MENNNFEIQPYNEFRTGLTFKEVRRSLKREADKLREKENKYMFITRKTVLGRWHQIKKSMYKEYLDLFDNYLLTNN